MNDCLGIGACLSWTKTGLGDNTMHNYTPMPFRLCQVFVYGGSTRTCHGVHNLWNDHLVNDIPGGSSHLENSRQFETTFMSPIPTKACWNDGVHYVAFWFLCTVPCPNRVTIFVAFSLLYFLIWCLCQRLIVDSQSFAYAMAWGGSSSICVYGCTILKFETPPLSKAKT